MRRREFLTLLGSAAAAAAGPLAARAQQTGPMRRIGVLMPYSKDDPEDQARLATLKGRLRELGWMEDRNIRFDHRWYEGDASRARVFAQELVEAKPDLIVVVASPGLAALREQNHTIPVVFAGVSDPLDQGFVDSLARPSGNITGFSIFEFSVGTKLLEALKRIAPGVMRVAILFNPETAPSLSRYLHSIETAVPTFGVELLRAPVRNVAEIEAAIAALGRQAGNGLMCLPDSFLNQQSHRELIIALAARYNVPAIYPFRFFVVDGGLMSYGVDMPDLYRRAASYVDRILKGEKPADLPVQQPTKYELVLNLKTARTLGLDIPLMLRALADEVIE